MTQAIATQRLFQTRDLFVHDGSHLRRLRLSAPVQMGMLVIMVLLLTWSAYSAVRLFLTPASPMAAPAAISSDLARLAAATEARVQQIEERQKLIQIGSRCGVRLLAQWSSSPIRCTWIRLVDPTVPGGAPATITT